MPVNSWQAIEQKISQLEQQKEMLMDPMVNFLLMFATVLNCCEITATMAWAFYDKSYKTIIIKNTDIVIF
jgi:hypothetical protein